MGALGKGKTRIGTQVSDDRAAYMLLRANRLDWTISKLGSRIIERWFEMGCPPLSAADAALPALPMPEDEEPQPLRAEPPRVAVARR